MFKNQDLMELYQEDITIKMQFRSALIVGDTLSQQSAGQVFKLISLLVANSNSEMELDDEIEVTLNVGDLMFIFDLMGNQNERMFAEVNRDLKTSLISSLMEKALDEEDEQHNTAVELLPILNSIQEDLESRMDQRALSAKSKLFG